MKTKFSERLQDLRKEAGLSQVKFAQTFNISNAAIAHWETGNREPPFNTLIDLANYFHVSTDYLLGLEEEDFQKNVPAQNLTDKEKEMLRMFKVLEDLEQVQVISYTESLYENRQRINAYKRKA